MRVVPDFQQMIKLSAARWKIILFYIVQTYCEVSSFSRRGAHYAWLIHTLPGMLFHIILYHQILMDQHFIRRNALNITFVRSNGEKKQLFQYFSWMGKILLSYNRTILAANLCKTCPIVCYIRLDTVRLD